MSAETKDYSLIQDEDVLKRMWQDTEDFGRKKDIRAHMYKIREARLRDFYNTGEVTSSTTIKTSKSTSKGSEMTHADSLADHSFLSLKSKEIRDSESPTRDAYKITGVTRSQDHGWDIIESNESSNDGKSRSTSRVATTAGKQQIQGGEANFAAKAEQKTSVYQDGDDKNFVKSVGTSSQNVVKQEAHGGDENSKFYSSSTTTRSSSKYSSEQKSSTGDVDVQSAPSKTVVRTYTENIPNDLKNNSNFIDGKTKVTTETKTLPDGSTVTTTRYETIGSKSYATSSSSKQTEQRSSESHHDSRRSSIHDDVKITKTPRIEVCNDQSSFTIVKNQDISRQNKFDDVEARRVQDSKIFDRNSSDVKIAEVTLSKEVKPTVDESTITRTVTKTVHTYDDRNSQPSVVDEKTTVTKTITVDEQPSSRTTKTVHTYDDRKAQPSVVDEKTTVTKTITVDEQPTCRTTKTINYIEQPTETINTKYTTHKISSDNFINTEREKLVEASEPSKPRREPQAEPKYETPERRQPIRPGKSEMDDTRSPLDGQYDTTYRTEFIPRRISVEVSPTHDAFARSLRSVSPVSSRAGSIRSLRTPSQASLRSSPEKFRTSPDHSKSPKRTPDGYKKSPERFDTIRTEVDSSTLTRKGRKPSRSPSPTTTASEIEFMTSVDTEDAKTIFKNQKITRRHTEDNVTDKRPTSLDVTTTTTTRKKKITERSPTSPLTDFSPRRPSPTKETKRRDSIKEQDVKSKKVLRRTDTYEERCKQILGIAEGQSTPRKPSLPDVARGKTPSKQSEKVQEFPSQIRKSPQKEPLGPYPEKKTPEKFRPKVQEFPSQIRKSPQKEPLEPYPQKSRRQSNPPNLNEFPSQIRKSPEKPLCVLSPEKEKTPKYTSKIDEFPSQARKSPEKLPLEPYPEKERTPKYTSKIDEFPSQTRKSPEKEPLEPYPEKSKPRSVGPKINEFPSQIRKSPGKEPLEPYPEKEKPAKYTSKINEFPSQTIRSPEKQPLEPYPEKNRTPKYTCKIDEFPSQTRKSLEKQPLEPYPEKSKPKSTAPKINEFPSQIQKSREREPLEPYPEKERTPKYTSKINEFPSQTIRSPEKEPLEQYPEKSKPKSSGPKINEFPSQVRKAPEKEPLEPYPEKERTPKYTSKINEFPSQTIKSSEKQPLEPYPEKSKPKSAAPQINEFPSQIPKSVDREPLEPYPEKERTPKYTSKIDEFPSQTRRSPERPQSRGSPYESSEFPSYRGKEKSPSPFRELRKSQDRVSLDDLPNMATDRRSMDRVSLSDLETTKHDTEVDFIRREKYDTDITLRKSKRTKSTKVSKIENGDDSSSTSEDEEDTTITEVTNITTGDTERKTVQKKTEKGHTVTKITTTKECQRSKPKGTKTEVVRKSPVTKKPKNEPVSTTEDEEETTTTEVIDITVVPSKTTKSKIQQTYKTTAIKDIRKVAPKPTTQKTEVVTVKKTFVTNAKKPAQEAPLVKKFIPTLCTKETRKTEKLLTLSPKEVTPHKIVKKDNPEKTLPKKPSEKLVKPNTGRFSGVTEYTDQYSKTTKVTHTPKVTTKITITPTIKQEDVTKTTKVETTKKTGRLLLNGDEKRTTTQTTRKVAPTKPDTSRHVVSAIINIKPKQKPTAPITKTVHKTTATKIVTNNKQKPIKTPKKIQNGHIPSDEEETDQEELIEKNKKSVKLEKKCIATKSILIENAVADQREIIVDLKRSKSSREGTPDRLCPYPVRPDDDSGVPRYPDNIVEPDEPRQRIKTVTNDIIHEDIEGISSTITEIKDESLLTVNEKVSKFLTTAEEITKKPKDFKPAPKVERPILDVDDELREDECLLSVSDKVSKFITTADQLTKTKQTTTRPKPVQIEDADANVDENDESLLSVSEKVSHFIATAEKVKETPKAKPRSKEPSRSPSPRKEVESPKKSPSRDSPKRSEICSRRLSEARRDSFDLETTPKSSRRTSKDEPRMALSPTERLRSTETIKKAKALFENISKEQEVSKQRDIVSRPSVFEGRRLKEQKEEPELRHRSRSPGDEEIPHYMTPLDRTVKEHQPRRVKTDEDSETEDEDYPHSSPDFGDLPHYMLPLDRSLREKSPHKESVKQIEDIMLRSTSSAQNEEVDTKTTKFGIQLRRTDSDRRSSLTQKQVTTKVETHDELNIEEIFDLEYLESLLETIVGYDIRRRIRAQIRIVKKMIEESKLEIVTTKSRSPVREIKETEQIRRGSSEYKSSYSSYSERRSSETKSTKTTTRESSPLARDKSPERKAKSPERKAKSPERIAKSPGRTPKSPERKPKSPERKTQSPDRKTSKTETTKVFQTELKKTKPATRKVFDEKPEWITRTTLKKVTDTPVKNTVVTTTTKTTTSRRVQKSPSKERAPTDVITSSYGVGPMDENGAPLFGLRALKAQNKSEKTKVQGTVIQSRYYSENGNEPVGEISVTKYSTDPKDLPISDSKKEKGVSSVTTTQKFGYKGTPSLKSITSKTKGIESGNTTTSTKTSKVTRRGSVKEISQKFIENAVDSLKNERQSSYPKAGLILRTSSFKDTDESPTSREGSPGYEETRRTVTTVKTSSTSGGKVDTFLTNKSRVTGVQDVITRMKNEETEGETAEDIEAKNLLNKFIGSQVLLSGIESSNKASGGRSSITKVTTTTTTSESGKPTKTVTKTFTHPITPELLKTVWDEQTLNLLLEQSSNNEDKRIIRTRLREVMAEQEACADLVEKASEEVTRQESKSSIHEKSFTEGPFTTTSQVTTRVTQQKVVPKPMSPFAKFRQLDKQNSLNSPPSTPKTPTGSGSMFKFTDPSLNQSANTVKQRLLQWCQMRTHGYENIQLDNFSTSWADGMAFCALIHRFVPDAFDYNALNPKNRRHNFTLAFKVAEDKAGIYPLLDVDDMVALSKPDWKCIFTYVQSIYRRFKDED